MAYWMYFIYILLTVSNASGQYNTTSGLNFSTSTEVLPNIHVQVVNSDPKKKIEDIYNLDEWQQYPEWFGNSILGLLASRPLERRTIQHLLNIYKAYSMNKPSNAPTFDLTSQLMRGYFIASPNYLNSTSGQNTLLGMGLIIEKELEDLTEDNYLHCKERKELCFYDGTTTELQKSVWLMEKVNWPKIIIMTLVSQPYELYQPAGVDDTCYADAVYMLRNFYVMNESWAQEMADSFGKPPIGIFQGNLNWIGQYDQCNLIKVNSVRRFDGSYCDIKMKLPDSIKVPSQPGKTLYLRMGLCFPSSCGASDVKLIMANLNVMGFMLPEVIESRCHADAPGSTGKFKTDALAITASAVMGALVLLVVICSIIDGICWYTPEDGLTWFSNRHEPKMIVNIQGQSNKVMELTDLSKPNSYENVTNEQIANGNGLVHKDPGIEMPQTMTVETVMIVAPAPDSLVKKLIQTFSLYKNVTALFQTKQPKGAVRSLDALRVFNMNWIILGHTYSMGAAFMQETLSNAKLAVEKVKDYTFMGVYSGMLAVDSYFFISGLLVSYLFLKTSAKNKGRWGPQLLIYYIHRLWRILPLYGILILVYAAFGQYLGSGPLFDWQSERVRDCNNNWWANLLFINNFYKPREMCLGWSWYLSNDMQFYVIAPIILIPLFLNAIAGGIIIGICFVAHWAVTAILWWRTDGQSYMQDPNIYYEAYITPYCRIGPYLVGLMLGYIFYKDYKLKQKLVAIVLWIVTIFLMGVVVYGQYGDVKDYGVTKPGWNRVQRTFYETFSRDVWGLCMAWIVYACNQGYAGFIGHILNWKGWTPLGRMTFATYLVHPIVIFIYVGNRRDLNHVDDFSVAFLYSGYVLLAYVSGAILSMIFEAPPAGLDRIVTKSLNGK